MELFGGHRRAVRDEVLVKELESQLVSVRNVQIVTEGITMGTLILKSVWLAVAPSMRAASMQRRPGMDCKAGDVNDHHVADLLPAHQDDQAPEAVALRSTTSSDCRRRTAGR